MNKQAALSEIEGLTFRNCVEFFAEKRSAESIAYVKQARNEMHRDGEVEIDDCAFVSLGDDDGAYVMAWVWVSK